MSFSCLDGRRSLAQRFEQQICEGQKKRLALLRNQLVSWFAVQR
jgi:hypothetical protein